MIDKIKSWCSHSVTIFWAYCKFIVGIIVAGLPFFADLFADGQVKTQILSILPASWTGWALTVIAIITYFARMRSIVSN